MCETRAHALLALCWAGSHNHGWLCGGVAAWLYGDVGGIAPAADGYAVVRVAPKISKTLGPAHVSMRLLTVRGFVTSSWTRSLHTGNGTAPSMAFVIGIPIGSRAHAVLPLLANASLCVFDVGVQDAPVRHRLLWGSHMPRGTMHAQVQGIDRMAVHRDNTSTHGDYVRWGVLCGITYTCATAQHSLHQ